MEFCNFAQRVCALSIVGSVSLVLAGCGGQSALDSVTPGQSFISHTYAAQSSASLLVSNLPAVADILGGKCPAQSGANNFLYMPFANAADLAGTPPNYFGVLSGSCTTDVLHSDGLVAMSASAIGSLTSLYGDYTGFVYDTEASKLRALTTTIAGNSFALDAVSAHVNFTAVDSPSAGFIQGNVDGQDLLCMSGVDVANSGKNALFCLVANPADLTKPFNLILASK